METPLLSLYAVRNRDGKWFRSKGYGGYGTSWVDDLKKARVYGKTGPARAQITYWANACPKFGIPDLVELRVTEMAVFSEEDRVQKARKATIAKNERIKIRRAEREQERLLKTIEESQKRLEKLKYGPAGL